jgi:hypothetical protein
MTTATEPASTDTPADTSTNKPAQVFKDRDLSVSIFPNTVTVRDREMTFFNSSIQPSYKDPKDGNAFKTTHTLGKDDLLRAGQLLSQAWAWIVTEESSLRKKSAA